MLWSKGGGRERIGWRLDLGDALPESEASCLSVGNAEVDF